MDLSLLNLKVGVIRKAERHPDADTLYVEEVDCGEEQPRTVHLPHPLLSLYQDFCQTCPYLSLPCRG